jgi:hypothetical protein
MGVRRQQVCRLVLQIGRAYYWLIPLRPGWRLKKRTGKCYDVRIDQTGAVACDCADATFRQRRCKHLRALEALTLVKGVAR